MLTRAEVAECLAEAFSESSEGGFVSLSDLRIAAGRALILAQQLAESGELAEEIALAAKAVRSLISDALRIELGDHVNVELRHPAIIALGDATDHLSCAIMARKAAKWALVAQEAA